MHIDSILRKSSAPFEGGKGGCEMPSPRSGIMFLAEKGKKKSQLAAARRDSKNEISYGIYQVEQNFF